MQDDLTTLYNVLQGRPTSAGGNLTGQGLGGLTLRAGVYNFDTSAGLADGKTLVLDGNGNPDAIFIFNIGSTLTVGSGSRIQLINGANGGNVFYRIGSSATLNTASAIEGQIVSLTSISLLTGAGIGCGAALARNGSVTLDTNTIEICTLTGRSFVDVITGTPPPDDDDGTPPPDDDGGTIPPDDDDTPPPINDSGTTTPTNPLIVAIALDEFVAGGGTLPTGFAILAATLTPAELAEALAQLSGEIATAVAPVGMQSTNSFLDTVLGGRSGPGISVAPPASAPPPPSTVSVLGYGPQPTHATDNRFATSHEAMPVPRSWDMWGAVYGGYSVVDGNAIGGSHERSSRDLGLALGVDYYLDPYSTIGLAVGKGATRFGLGDNYGSGRSDTFHVAVHGRRQFEAAYLAGALAYGYSDVTTDRTVTIAGTDHFAARFGAHNVAGHVEGGYRIGWLTPYAAVRAQSFMTPSYSERTVSGASTFALDYAARTATSLRTELGAHADWRTEFNDNSVLMLRLRAAWVHEYGSNAVANASFQSLPGSAFTVSGATADRNSLLMSAGAEFRLRQGFFVAGSLNGSLARDAHAYGGAVKLGFSF